MIARKAFSRLLGLSDPAQLPSLGAVRSRTLFSDDSGAATAEYALITLGAAAFAGLLVVILRSDEVRGILADIVRNALSLP